MNKNLIQSDLLRNLYYAKNKAVSRCQIWRKGSKIFINSLPKSGTHLVTSLLEATGEIKSAGRHLRTVDFDINESGRTFALDVDKFVKEESRVRGKQYFSAHFPWDKNIEAVFDGSKMKILNVIRDPRDMIVSRYHYIMDLKRHFLNEFLTNHYDSDEDRILALINGPPVDAVSAPDKFLPYKITLERFEGWQKSPFVMTVRYEDIIGPRGSGSLEVQYETIRRLLEFVGVEVNDHEIENLIPKFLGVNTATMRSGTSGEWKAKLSEAAQVAVNRELRDVILRMGYEF